MVLGGDFRVLRTCGCRVMGVGLLGLGLNVGRTVTPKGQGKGKMSAHRCPMGMLTVGDPRIGSRWRLGSRAAATSNG